MKQDETILFTIGVPIYNKEKYLKRCLESVCGQTYQKIEILLVDDGSTDRSGAIAKRWAEKDRRISVLWKENGGLWSARNEALKAAKGDYILFVDADDSISKDLVQIAADRIGHGQPDCIIFENYILTGRHKWICCHADMEHCWKAGSTEFYKKLFGADQPLIGTAVWNKVFRLDVIRRHDIWFQNLAVGEDMRFCLDFAWVSEDWVRIPRPLYHYYQNDDSIMHDFDSRFEKKIQNLMLEAEKFAKEKGIYKELRPAISCVQLRDCLTICRYYSSTCSGHRDFYQRLRDFTKNRFYRKRFLLADRRLMPKKYLVFYLLLKYRMTVLLVLMLKLYERGYR